MGVQAFPGEKFEGRAATVSGANSWSTVCLLPSGSHPPAAAESEAPSGTQKKEGKPSDNPKITNFAKFPSF